MDGTLGGGGSGGRNLCAFTVRRRYADRRDLDTDALQATEGKMRDYPAIKSLATKQFTLIKRVMRT